MSRTPFASLDDLRAGIRPALALTSTDVEVIDEAAVRGGVIDRLIFTVVFGPQELRPVATWIIRVIAPKLGAYPASIHDLYMAAGRHDYANATAPAINVRSLTYDQARIIFQAAMANNTKLVLFELARSEMSYTWQHAYEYVAGVLAGAIKAGYRGPVFVQGDHYQFVARNYAKDAAGERDKVETLIKDAIAAGYYNIDIDASTLVDLSKPTLVEQQEMNYRLTAELTQLIRKLEPAGITVSIGGEIGEVGTQNSTVEDLHAFMGGYEAELKKLGGNLVGISKISVQTGTSHGGVVLPDGTMAQVSVDFQTLADLSAAAKTSYGLGGAVQHGASTLPEAAFGRFAEADAVEVHLATAFQNQLLDHPAFPAELKQRMYAYLDEKVSDERKPTQTDAQFYYTSRKKVFGPFKQELWNLPDATREEILASLSQTYALVLQRLGVAGKAALVDQYIKPVHVDVPVPAALTGA